MNIVGGPPSSFGSTINALPTQEKAFTKRASGARSWSCSISDRSRVVKNRSTPFTGGASAIGFVTSITVFPARASAPARSMTDAAADPFTARTTNSPLLAASAKLPTEAFAPAFAIQASSFLGSRVPRTTSCPRERNPSARVSPTTPEPRTAIVFMASSVLLPSPDPPFGSLREATGQYAAGVRQGPEGNSRRLPLSRPTPPGKRRSPSWEGLLLRSRVRRKLAGPTGLEPATSGVTGRRSNQLNYDPAVVPGEDRFHHWWEVQVSNL